jgi:hypothetical protein
MVWYMGGPQGVDPVHVQDTDPPMLASMQDWALEGVADFNGDGWPDILARSRSSDAMQVFFMKEHTYLSKQAIEPPLGPGARWTVTAIADYNGDGHPDIIWRQQAFGQNHVWLMEGVRRIGTADIAPLADNKWVIVGPR